MHRVIGAVAFIAGCLWGEITLAQDVKTPDTPAPNDPVAAMIGNWQFSNADQDKVCHFVFRNDPAPGGQRFVVIRQSDIGPRSIVFAQDWLAAQEKK